MWNIFRSVKLTIVLFIILALASIMGTLIPQQEGAVDFARGLSPGLFRFLSSLDLFDMYHSIWFRIIIGALTINLLVCSIDRLPATLKRFRARPGADRSRPFENLPEHRTFAMDGKEEDIRNDVSELLKSRYKGVEVKVTSKMDFLYGDKGRYSYFGVYLVHLSVLIILTGGIVGSFSGFEGFVNIAEGDTVDTVFLRQDKRPKRLGFSVKCEKFTVKFYDRGTPKEYRSDLIFSINGKVAEKGSLLVNHPITFRGITFYQASYGSIPGERVRLRIVRKGTEPTNTIAEVALGQSTPLPGNGGEFKLADIRPDFMRMGPAVLILIRPPGGEEIRFWVFQRYMSLKKQLPGIFEKFSRLNPAIYKPYTFFLDDIASRYYTGLQVNKDPGVSLVWLGCFMMVIGFFVTFFSSHRQVWVRISKGKAKQRISVAGRSNKNPVGLERELDQLANRLRRNLAPGI